MVNSTIVALLVILCASFSPAIRAFPASLSVQHVDEGGNLHPFGKDFVPKNLLILGDSYSDSCNYVRFLNNDTAKVPFPTCYPRPKGRAVEGTAWPEAYRELQGQIETSDGPPGGSPSSGKSNQTTVVNLAFASAVCDNYLFPINSTIVAPSVRDQIDLLQNGYNGTLTPGFGPTSVANRANAETDVALIWIGTNDLTFFIINTTDNKALNTHYMQYYKLPTGSILSYLDCVFDRFEQLYNLGYRKFVLFEMIPLGLTPEMNPARSVNPQNGAVPFGIPLVIQQMVLTTNYIYPIKAKEFEQSHKGAKIQIFPTHELFRRFYFHPQEYGFNNTQTVCANCTFSPEGDLWADDLHFSTHAARLIARKLARFFKGARGDDLLRGED